MNGDKERMALVLYRIFYRQQLAKRKYERGVRGTVKPIFGITLKYLVELGQLSVHRVTAYRSLKQMEHDGLLVLHGKTWYPSPTLEREIDGSIRDTKELWISEL